jgi:tetratricopeptide (TPR) repeat protein
MVAYSVWVFFNFDWAPATGVFWLLAGTLWSASLPRSPGEVAPSVPRLPGKVAPSQSDRAGWGPAVSQSLLAAALAVVAAVFAVFPVLADVWYVHGRADLAVRIDPLQAQYHWALGQGLVARDDLAGGVAELRHAADLGETEPGLYVELGDREAQLGRRDEARRAYERALQVDPFYTPAKQRLRALGG